MNKKIFVAFLFILSVNSLNAQIVYEPLFRDVYVFLDRLAQKGVIEYNDQIKPLSRRYIAEKLTESLLKEHLMTTLEKEELAFYKADFFNELSSISKTDTIPAGEGATRIIENDSGGRLRLLSYADNLFKINLSPVYGYERGSDDGKSYAHTWNGAYFYGSLTDRIGFSFDFRDNSEKGDNIDRTKAFTPVTGIVVAKASANEVQYSEIRTTLATGWSWGSFTVGKDFLKWGHGESGQLVLSDKAPSFPFIRLDINPVRWLSFNYIHGWLSSDVPDSNAMYASYRKGIKYDREIFRDKFYASHTLTFRLSPELYIALGESVVYSDKLELAYLMPLMFFRSADHYLSQGGNNAGANSQFFLGVSSRNQIRNTHLYGTLYIDELTLEGLTDPQKQRTQIGFSLGGSVTDLPLDNLTLTLEYTKTYPFVYRHYIPTQTYSNANYQMGYWAGDNADIIYASLNYRILRGFQASVWGEVIRKGEYPFNEGVEAQYEVPQPPFLYGLRRNYSYTGLNVKYEITHELFARGRFIYSRSSFEQTNGGFTEADAKAFYLALYYGL
ncbi:MAG: hypothetical protein WCJ01_04580 [Ignavibacteria bacterium]